MAFLVLLLFFVVMYMLMIRPQQRRAREHQALVASVQVGDEIMTTAGIFGRITALEDSAVSIEIAPGVVVRVARAAVGQRTGPDVEELLDPDPDVIDSPSTEVETVIEPPVIEPPAEPPPPPASSESPPASSPEAGRESPWGDWGRSGPEGG
jgi:preprotein translocase subunit YajC